MRMWMVDPRILCRSHLLGEHGEIHKHRHNFVKGHSMAGRIAINAVEPLAMQARHDALAAEMAEREYNHQSPYDQPDLTHYPDSVRLATVDTDASLAMLLDRCPECRRRHSQQRGQGDD